MKNKIHQLIIQKRDLLQAWFLEKSKNCYFPIYTSYDIRDSGFKVCPVDANIFPAGFNNICAVDKESASLTMKNYIQGNYGGIKNILLISEEHTKNLFYLENVFWLKKIIEDAGYQVKISFAKELDEPLTLKSSMGNDVLIEPALRSSNSVSVGNFKPDLIVSNNDFTVSYTDWMDNLETPVNPHYDLGWHKRRKHVFFENYNQLVTEFCEIIDVDPWCFQIQTEVLENFSLTDSDSIAKLAETVDLLKSKLQIKYNENDIDSEPYLFIKNASGTYGMGVTRVSSGEEVLQWNSKARKKMKASKGNVGVSNIIIQEGIPTTITEDEQTAEPAIYMIGNQLAGGFLRVHKDKGPMDSLNSPGAVFKRLCISDLSIDAQDCELENVYGWIGRIGALAVAKEAESAVPSPLS